MNSRTLMPLALSLLFATLAYAQSAAPAGTAQPQHTFETVETVGCLEAAPAAAWILTNATDPVVSKTPATTTAALKDAAARPLGSQRFRLLGVSVFNPQLNKGHKVAVKGILIKTAQETRLNVTSLQTVGASCPK